MGKFNLTLLKDCKIEIFALISLLAIQFILFGNLLSGVVGTLIALLLSLVMLVKKEEVIKKLKDKQASYSFFLCFIKGIEDNVGVKASYESASRYLVSHQEIIPYEELDSNHNLLLYDFQKYFNFILLKDQNNEAQILFYRPLMEEVKLKLHLLEEDIAKIKKRYLYLMLFLLALLLLLVTFTSMQNIKEVFTSSIYFMASAFLLSLLAPCYFFMEYQSYRGILNA